jgi:predicted ATPase/DNA-binding CsgD family transcriptional regulator
MNEQRATRPSSNLPIAASSFVGRRIELAEVRRRMTASRLLTLTGPGGVGKTRLAVQAGILACRAFPDGVWLADLSALTDSSRLADTVAAALGVNDQSVRPAAEQLADHLAARRVLVILDNCEHLVPDCAQLADDLLRQAPGLRVLVTSRQTLGLPGEQVLIIDPLSAPDPGSSPPADVLAKYESVALLIDRATAVQPAFRVHDANRDAVARLCSRLDGLPLAIELAATRLRALSVEQVADRLDDRFSLLTKGSPAALSRQQTLRALMDWSYDLCTREEQGLWGRLSVFPGEFDLAAVEGICTGQEAGLTADSVLGVLDELVAKSIVSASSDLSPMRYRMLETIRQYGHELLTGEITSALRRRHRDYYLNLAVRCSESWCGPDQAAILTRLRVEQANFTAALDWSLSEPGESQAALVLIMAMRHHLMLGDFLANGRRLIDKVLHVAREPSAERGYALCIASALALIQGDSGTAADWMRESSDIAGRHADDRLHGYVRLVRGSSALFDGDIAGAVREFEAGLDLMRRAGDLEAVLWGQFQYSVALTLCGRSAAARAECAEAIQLAESQREQWARSQAKWACGFDHWVTGDHVGQAADLVREALALTPNANHVSTVLDIELLAWIAASGSRPHEAARLLGAAAAIWDTLGTRIEAFGPFFARYSAECRASVISALEAPRFRVLLAEGMARAKVPPRPLQDAANQGEMPVQGGPPPLTRRELEVARLIAKGLTNKAIAAELVLSRRTVDGHVERLFAKLGVTTRAQAAVWMSRHDSVS